MVKFFILNVFCVIFSSGQSCDPNQYCQKLVGPTSYCKTWLATSACQGGDQYTYCSTCGGSSSTTYAPLTTKPMVMTLSTSTTSTARPATTSTSMKPPVSSVVASADCEAKPVNAAPLFLWVEGPRLYAKSDFVSLYRRLKIFMDNNCANIRVTTLVVRTAHPYYPTQLAEGVYWPPWNSPLYTEVISKLSGSGVKILLYPYIMESYDRLQWVTFAHRRGVRPVVASSLTAYDGIFAYTKGWQDFVNSNNTATIDGFVLDYEEIFRRIGTEYAVELTPEAFPPYRAAYPMVKTATTVGYDDKRNINYFDPFMDYIYLQVYDLYYPYVGSDATMDSIFETYRDDADGLVNLILKNVLTSTILDTYSARTSKIKLMWSTQSLVEKNCLYKINDGSCGINNEFNWSPAAFNAFMRKISSSAAGTVLDSVEHGIYTWNFMRQDYLVKSSRDR